MGSSQSMEIEVFFQVFVDSTPTPKQQQKQQPTFRSEIMLLILLGSKDHAKSWRSFSTAKENLGSEPGTHLAVIVFLALVSLDGADDIAGILNHHLTCIDVSLTEKTPTVDGRPRPWTQKTRHKFPLSNFLHLLILYVWVSCLYVYMCTMSCLLPVVVWRRHWIV